VFVAVSMNGSFVDIKELHVDARPRALIDPERLFIQSRGSDQELTLNIRAAQRDEVRQLPRTPCRQLLWSLLSLVPAHYLSLHYQAQVWPAQTQKPLPRSRALG